MKSRIFVIFIVVGFIISIIIGIGVSLAPKSPISVMNKFYTAYNSHDIDTMITCLDPKIEKAYLKINKTISNFFGIGINEIADLGSVLEDIGIVSDSNIDINRISIISVDYSGSKTGNAGLFLVNKIDWIGNIIGTDAKVSISYPDIESKSMVFVTLQFENFEDIGWRIIDGSFDLKSGSVSSN